MKPLFISPFATAVTAILPAYEPIIPAWDTDWSQYAGRDAVIWLDDAPTAIGEAATIAAALTGTVKTIEPAPFAAAPATKGELIAWLKGRVMHATPARQPAPKPPTPVAQAITTEQTVTQPAPPPPAPALTLVSKQGLRVAVSKAIAWQELGLKITAQGTPVMDSLNIIEGMARDPNLKGKFWKNTFDGAIYTNWNSPHDSEVREFSDFDGFNLQVYLQEKFNMRKLSDTIVWQAVTTYATRNPINPVQDWLKSLAWDGVPRVSKFFTDICGADATDYTTDVSEQFWLSIVARIMRPACQADCMVVLEGGQGIGKSTLLQAIGGQYYGTPTSQVTSKDFLQELNGKFLIEVEEMQSFSNADKNQIKKILSQRIDRYRPPYGRAVVQRERQCVFVGTTNEGQYLIDDTGGRRFYPIQCKSIALNQFRPLRDQYFAEALTKLSLVEDWYRQPTDAQNQQDSRRVDDSWGNAVRAWLLKAPDNPSTAQIARDALDIPLPELSKQSEKRIGYIMRSAGYSNNARVDGKRVWSKGRG